jgi:polypeptide N-acetylgalactosaminyltransferase
LFLEFLKEELEDHIAENFKNDLVKIIRNKKREGLIRTRMAGANIAKAEILVFFGKSFFFTESI